MKRSYLLIISIVFSTFFFSCEVMEPELEVVDPCATVACLNGGDCVDGTCICPDGFCGDFCELECANDAKILNRFSLLDECNGVSFGYEILVSELITDSSDLNIFNLFNNNWNIYGVSNTNGFEIPLQGYGTGQIEGEAILEDLVLNFNYKVYYVNGSEANCLGFGVLSGQGCEPYLENNVDLGCFDENFSSEPPCHDNSNLLCWVVVDDVIKLSDKAKQHFPQFCMDSGDEMAFINQDNEISMFRIQNKEREIYRYFDYSYVQKCPDTGETRNFCANTERLRMSIVSEDVNTNMDIQLRAKLDRYAQSGANFGYLLEINITGFSGIFSKIVDRGTTNISRFVGEEFYEIIELNGKTFENISSFSSPHGHTDYKFYYSHQLGLIGIEDNVKENLWVIN